MIHQKLVITLLGSAFLLLGCNPQQPKVQQPVKVKEVKATKTYVPPAPKKDIKLKEVEDENFSSDYMYPETAKKSSAKVAETTSVADAAPAAMMTASECVSIIGQEKFERYSQMYGGDAGAIKKCKMLKAL